MAINLGSTAIAGAYVGTTSVSKIYLGSAQIYPNTTPVVIKAVKFTSANAQTLGVNQNTLGSITPNFEYSTDNGSTWSSWNVANTVSFGNGTDLYLRGMNTFLAKAGSNYVNFVFSTSSPVYCSGNIMHLFDYTQDLDTIPDDSSQTSRGIKYMFSNCTQLVTPPDLPAINITRTCYFHTFELCSSLTTPPALPALTVYQESYSYMFSGCTSLTSIPALAATSVGDSAYNQMFLGCSQIYMNTTQTDEYINEYRFGVTPPVTSVNNMFAYTGNPVSGVVTPASQVLYTKNTIIS